VESNGFCRGSRIAEGIGIVVTHQSHICQIGDLDQCLIFYFIPHNTMMERAGMSEMNIYHRTRNISHYFNLPFDAPLPGDFSQN
jgi:hypothetical protein